MWVALFGMGGLVGLGGCEEVCAEEEMGVGMGGIEEDRCSSLICKGSKLFGAVDCIGL